MELKEERPASCPQIMPLNYSGEDTAAFTTDHWVPQLATSYHQHCYMSMLGELPVLL